jgi:hypothetical protein
VQDCKCAKGEGTHRHALLSHGGKRRSPLVCGHVSTPRRSSLAAEEGSHCRHIRHTRYFRALALLLRQCPVRGLARAHSARARTLGVGGSTPRSARTWAAGTAWAPTGTPQRVCVDVVRERARCVRESPRFVLRAAGRSLNALIGCVCCVPHSVFVRPQGPTTSLPACCAHCVDGVTRPLPRFMMRRHI